MERMTLAEFRIHTRREAEECARHAETVRAHWHKAARLSLYTSIFTSSMAGSGLLFGVVAWVCWANISLAVAECGFAIAQKRRGDRDFREFMEFRQRYLDSYEEAAEAIRQAKSMLQAEEGEEWKAEDAP